MGPKSADLFRQLILAHSLLGITAIHFCLTKSRKDKFFKISLRNYRFSHLLIRNLHMSLLGLLFTIITRLKKIRTKKMLILKTK